MLLRDTLHVGGHESTIQIQQKNAIVSMNEVGVIDTEKAMPFRKGTEPAPASEIARFLLERSRYQRFTPKELKAPEASEAPVAPQNGKGDDERGTVLDVGEMSVAAVRTALKSGEVSPKQAQQWLEQEKAGKKRKSLLKDLKKHLRTE